MKKSRYIMIGGFLGAGKTTAVAQLARWLANQGLRVGLITNDQGSELVDTAMLRARGFATEEIAGGCFCCRFNSLTAAADKLTSEAAPDVFIAEPAGSCTDLVATVTYPLRRLYGDSYSIAPLSVLVDPVRAARIFGLENGGTFSKKVLYIYRKQLEEADIIVIGKCELLTEDQIDALKSKLANEFPRAEILTASPRSGGNLEPWFTRLVNEEQTPRNAIEVDYEIYADGEALLGWLNATVALSASETFDANEVLQQLCDAIATRLADTEIAHLKMTLSPDGGIGDIAAINLVRNDVVSELSLRLDDPVQSAQLIINLRAEAAPEILRDAVQNAVSSVPIFAQGINARIEHLEFFRPGKPVPTHRDTALAESHL